MKNLSLSPIQKVILSFILFIIFGALLLKLPFATTESISFIDAIFTSTSAVCVTGLAVLDTAKDFTLAGQMIILLLIQFGGLGIMTLSIAVLSLVGAQFSMKWSFTFQSLYNDLNTFPITKLLKKIIFYTFIIELVTAVALFTQFYKDFSLLPAIWHSVFHAVSAFCNAGFSTFSDSLVSYSSNSPVIITTSIAVITGGLGFLVLLDITNFRKQPKKRVKKRFSFHTKIVLTASFALIFIGTLGFLILENNYTLAQLPVQEKLLASYFQSVSCRTAGFNTVNISHLRESTLFFMIGLMFIGGSPGSIAGGIKTTTILIVLALIISKITGKQQIALWRNGINKDIVEKSTTLIILASIFIYFATFCLLFLNSFDKDHSVIAALFEMTSAFSTVGLTTGITSTMGIENKLLTSLVMLFGRLGPLTLISAISSKAKESPIEYADQQIMIG